jgi:hypothetical protein
VAGDGGGVFQVAGENAGLRIEYVAEVIVDSVNGARIRGSGYLVCSGKVLTAAHVVADAANVRVRFNADRPLEERVADASVAWVDRDIDVAVLAVPGEEAVPVRTGRVGEQDAVLRCSAVGFPQFKVRTDTDGSRYRDLEHVHANCAVWANRREGTLDLRVAPPAASGPPSPWHGMSGAAVFSGGLLIGLIAKHHLADGPGRLAATRVDQWAGTLGEAGLRELERLSGLALRPAALPDVLPVPDLVAATIAYRAQLEGIAPQTLEDRDDEYQLLVDFCAGNDPYLWIQGPPWAGKTALVSSFVLHPPRGVVPVWFLVNNRLVEQSDATAYMEVLIHQLSVLAGRQPADLTGAARDGERRRLLIEAAEGLAAWGGTLLLVVDGLDEDQAMRADGRGTSIASLLPDRLPPNVRVLVTSRPISRLPSDVVGGHPLYGSRVHGLSAVAAARHTEHEARHDLSSALRGDRLGRDLVGLLAAARGSLTVDNLHELSGADWYDVNQRLGSAFGRILRVGSPKSGHALNDSLGGGGLQFAHDTLFATVVDQFGPDIEVFRNRVHAWAEGYAARGWPAGTPAYLLHAYGRVVIALRDTARATALATDAARHERLREVTGSDGDALAEIDLVRELVRERAPQDLAALATIAAARDLLARRNTALYPGLPAAHARLGQTERAIGMTRSLFEPARQSLGLARVALVLAEARDQLRARALVAEAVSLITRAADPDAGHHCEPFVHEVVRACMRALLALGEEPAAVELLNDFSPDPVDGRRNGPYAHVRALVGRDPLEWVRTLTETATVARGRGAACACVLLEEAERTACSMTDADAITALAVVAMEYGKRRESARAARLYDQIEELVARYDADAHVRATGPVALQVQRELLVEGAVALHPVRPEVVRHLIRRLYAEGAAALIKLPLPTRSDPFAYDSPALTAVVRAVQVLARTGDEKRAAALLDRADQRLHSSFFGRSKLWEGTSDAVRVIAAHHLSERRPAAAVKLLTRLGAELLPGRLFPYRELLPSLAEVPGALDQIDELLSETDKTEDPQAMVELLVAFAERLSDQDPNKAAELVARAERLEPERNMIDGGGEEQLAELAVALGVVGRAADSETLLRRFQMPHLRIAAGALAASALARTHPADAARLADAAGEDATQAAGGWVPNEVLVQALWRAGREEQAKVLAEEGDASVLVFLVRALGDSHPRDKRFSTVAKLTDLAETTVLDGLRGSNWHPTGVIWLAGLVGTLRGRDPQRSARVLDGLRVAVRHRDLRPWPQSRLLASLLTHDIDPEEARRWLDGARELRAEGEEPPLDGTTSDGFAGWHSALALTLAVLGHHGAAVTTARAVQGDRERAEALGLLAGYFAQAHRPPLAAQVHLNHYAFLSVAAELAALSPPQDQPAARALARDLVADILATSDWHEALPALALLDPQAVLRLRDVVLAHLGLPPA